MLVRATFWFACVFPFHSRVPGGCPVTTDLIRYCENNSNNTRLCIYISTRHRSFLPGSPCLIFLTRQQQQQQQQRRR